MRDVELYRHLLGLESPWTIQTVALNVREHRVDVWADHAAEMRWACPECRTELPLYGHSEERVWRHLDSCQFLTYPHARPPRVQCPTHGVRQVQLPWAEPRARFTTLFERLAIDLLLEADILGASRILRISWDEAWHILERAVARGQRAKAPRLSAYVGVDEKALAKRHQYFTLVYDLDRTTVEFIGEELLLAERAPITYFAEQLGHANAATTLRYWIPSKGQRWANLKGARPEPALDVPRRSLAELRGPFGSRTPRPSRCDRSRRRWTGTRCRSSFPAIGSPPAPAPSPAMRVGVWSSSSAYSRWSA